MTDGFSVLLSTLGESHRDEMAAVVRECNEAHEAWQNASSVDDALAALDRKHAAWAKRRHLELPLKAAAS